ncbi:MAG: TnpV protein [Acutalibacteraceae bacterium]|nr:TnpV protein [Acutalibacteraceae bacterium]
MQGDYRLPDLTLPEQPEAPMGRFAQLRAKYLKENRKVLYYNLLTSCKLNEHLTEVEQTATELTERLTKEVQEKEGVTESLKATDMMSWVRQMNNIRSRVQETVLKQVVYA